jgi:hypothetical protein
MNLQLDLAAQNALRNIAAAVQDALQATTLAPKDYLVPFRDDFDRRYNRIQVDPARYSRQDEAITGEAQAREIAEAIVEAAAKHIFTGPVIDNDLRGSWDKICQDIRSGSNPVDMVTTAQRLVAEQARSACKDLRKWRARSWFTQAEPAAAPRPQMRPALSSFPDSAYGEKRPNDSAQTRFMGTEYCREWARWTKKGGGEPFRCPRGENCRFRPCNGQPLQDGAYAFFASGGGRRGQ